MNLLDRYVIRAVLGGVLVVLAVLLTLFALFLFAGQQDDIGQGSYTALDAFWFVLLNMPQLVYELMPIGVLIGALLGLGQLARGSELTVMRAAGISVWRIAGSVAMAGLLLTILAVVCGEFLAPPLQAIAKQQKALAKFSNITFASRGGAWVRDGNLLINVMEQSGTSRIRRHADLRAVARTRAAVGGRRILRDRAEGRQLEALAVTRARASAASAIESEKQASRVFESKVGGDFLELTVAQPRQLETARVVGI